MSHDDEFAAQSRRFFDEVFDSPASDPEHPVRSRSQVRRLAALDPASAAQRIIDLEDAVRVLLDNADDATDDALLVRRADVRRLRGALQNERTPPQVVEAAERPNAALLAFIAQELERWGFGAIFDDDGRLIVQAGERTFRVRTLAWPGERRPQPPSAPREPEPEPSGSGPFGF